MRRFIVVGILISVGFAGISYLHFTEMKKPLPAFADLKPISAQELEHTVYRHSIEFKDKTGHRYQTAYLDPPVLEKVLSHLKSGNVTLYCGDWKSALKSAHISSVYHITSGDTVLVDYRSLVLKKKKEQKGAWPIIIVSGIITAGILLWVFRRNMIESNANMA